MTSQERTQALSGLARQIATELRKLLPARPWTFVEPTEDTYSVYLRNAGKGRIYLSFDGYNEPTRLSISGHLHIGKDNRFVEVYERSSRVTLPSITVAIKRGPEAVAKDIAKRFLPEYLRILELAEQKVAEAAAYEATIAEHRNHLAAVCGVKLHPQDECHDFSWHLGGYHTVKINEKNVDLKLVDLSFAQAEHIIKYLKETTTCNTQ